MFRLFSSKIKLISLFILLVLISSFTPGLGVDEANAQTCQGDMFTTEHCAETDYFVDNVAALAACKARVAELSYDGDVYCNTYTTNGNPPYRVVVEAGYLLANGINFLIDYYHGEYVVEIPPSTESGCSETGGNPCTIAGGVKVQTELDFVSQGINSLSLSRHYSSSPSPLSPVGNNWGHNYSYSLDHSLQYITIKEPSGSDPIFLTPDAACANWIGMRQTVYKKTLQYSTSVYNNGFCDIYLNGEIVAHLPVRPTFDEAFLMISIDRVILTRMNSETIVFEGGGGYWHNPFDPKMTLEKLTSSWVLTKENGDQEIYDLDGKLVELISRGGITQNLEYDLSLAQGGDDNVLTLDRVSDEFGYELLFSYDANDNISQVETPKGFVIYQYDVDDRLIAVTYEDGEAKQYVYEDINFPNYLTGIIDEKGVRFATWQYDSLGRVISSEHAGGVESYTQSYPYSTVTNTTDALGATRQYNFSFAEGALRIKNVTGDRCVNCNHSSFKSQVLNSDGQITRRVDWRGNTIEYEYTNDFLTKETRAVNTPEEVEINTVWNETLMVPISITQENLKVEYSYDGKGLLLSETFTDTVIAESRTTTFAYNNDGQVISVDGPRVNVNDISTFEYDAQGRLIKSINALGHVTEITSFDPAGAPLTIIHPNNIVEQRTYSLRGWLLSQDVSGALTQFEYDPVGQLIKITSPNNTVQHFEYDDAQRLIAVEDGLGNRTQFTLDLASNLTQTQLLRADDSVTYVQSQEYDILSQLIKTISGQNIEQTVSYDQQGNVTGFTNGLNNTSTLTLDALSRLTEQLDPDGNSTQFIYDGLDNLLSVTDAQGNATQYQYNAFGETTSLISPDTGLTTFNYDSAGNVISSTDARGVTTQNTYDALNRLTLVHYPSNSAEDIIYQYDQLAGGFGLGRLTNQQDQTGSTDMVYDNRGNLIQEVVSIQNNTYTTEYAYDLADTLIQTTYPSGRVVNHQLDSVGRTTSVSTQATTLAPNINVINNVSYLPFGPGVEYEQGNLLKTSMSYDLDYRLSSLNVEDNSGIGNPDILNRSYSFDANNNITDIVNGLNNNSSQVFSYDVLDRLIGAGGDYGIQVFAYDNVGNRLVSDTTKDSVNTVQNFTYDANSNRLLSVDDGTAVRTLQYDASGNIVSDDRGSEDGVLFEYNEQNRLIEVTPEGVQP